MGRGGRWADIRRKGETYVMQVRRRHPRVTKIAECVTPVAEGRLFEQLMQPFDQNREEDLQEMRLARRGHHPVSRLAETGAVPVTNSADSSGDKLVVAAPLGPKGLPQPERQDDEKVRQHNLTPGALLASRVRAGTITTPSKGTTRSRRRSRISWKGLPWPSI